MPEMFHDARCQKSLTVIIKVEAPRIDRSVGDHFKLVPSRMVTPDATAQVDTIFSRITRTPNVRWLLDSVPTIEPAIGPPRQPIHAVVFCFERPAIKMHNRIAIRYIV